MTRRINFTTQAQPLSLVFANVNNDVVHGTLGAKAIDIFVQGAAPLAVAANAASIDVTSTVTGSLLFADTAMYSDANSRIVNVGAFATRDTDAGLFNKSMLVLVNGATNEVILNATGKQYVAFLFLNVAAATRVFKFYVDNNDGTYTATALPNGVASIGYQFLNRTTLDAMDPAALTTKKFFHGVVDLAVESDLAQLRKDLYGSLGTAFNGTGAAALGVSIYDTIENHILLATGAHAGSAISVTPSGNLVSNNVQAALVELQGDIDALVASQANTNNTAGTNSTKIANMESALGLNADGTLTALTGTYIANDTVRAALEAIDGQLVANANSIATNTGNITTNTNNIAGNTTKITNIETAVGLNADGSMTVFSATNYLNGVTTIKAAETTLDSALHTLAATIGIYVDSEDLTVNADNVTYTIASANGIVAGSKPMLSLNGVIQSYGDDYTIGNDASGKPRIISFVGPAPDPTKDLLTIWYRASLT